MEKPFKCQPMTFPTAWECLLMGSPHISTMSSKKLFEELVPESDLETRVLCACAGVHYQYPIRAKDLTPLAFLWWQILVRNIIPQGGHFNHIGSLEISLLWNIVNRQCINLPILILNHMYQCQNQGGHLSLMLVCCCSRRDEVPQVHMSSFSLSPLSRMNLGWETKFRRIQGWRYHSDPKMENTMNKTCHSLGQRSTFGIDAVVKYDMCLLSPPNPFVDEFLVTQFERLNTRVGSHWWGKMLQP